MSAKSRSGPERDIDPARIIDPLGLKEVGNGEQLEPWMSPPGRGIETRASGFGAHQSRRLSQADQYPDLSVFSLDGAVPLSREP